MEYRVDTRDVKFQLLEWLPTRELLEHFPDWDGDSVGMVLDEALKISQDTLAPTNQDGDRIGARWSDGEVTLPPSFAPAYRTVVEGGWVGSVSSPEFGGMGLPEVIGTAINEYFFGANMSLSLTILLTRGAAKLIEDHGTDALKAQYCEKMYTGEWTGTMCLTEPQAGSDVGASRTKAVKQDDGSYLLTGEKIFITSGNHDLTENIVHTVLARTPDAPPGTKGLSLFVVPKHSLTDDGSVGEANDVFCAGIEEKLGIHGSPTCSIVFGQNGGARGYLLGAEGEGMRLMFDMMNAARIEVGLQGQAIAGAAHQAALAFARERLQSRHWKKAADRAAPQVAIVEHPDVRRMLFTSQAYVEAMRALLFRTAFYADQAHHGTDDEKHAAQGYVEVLTPICKAWCSDWGFRVTEWCLQVFGGYGYTREYAAEQYLRDAKIASIYEGTNGIQALDLVGRKLGYRNGEPARGLLGMAAATHQRLSDHPVLGPAAGLLGEALATAGSVMADQNGKPEGAMVLLLNAVPILDIVGATLGAHLLLDQAELAHRRLGEMLEEAGVNADDEEALRGFLAGNADAAFYHNKVQSAIHFAYRALPGVKALSVPVAAAELSPMKAVF